MRTLIKMAWRNIWRNKRRSLISMASVLFAVLFAIAAVSLERGSYELKIENVVNFSTGYLQIQDVLYEEEPSVDNMMIYDEEIETVLSGFGNEIKLTVPRVQGFALAATDKKTRGVMVTGIDPESEDRFNKLSEHVVAGTYLKDTDDAVLIAAGLADILGLSVGDTLVMIGQGFQGSNAAGMFPVKGIVRLSLPDMNNNVVYMPLKAAQWFYDAGDRITSLIIMPVRPKQTTKLAAQIQEKLDNEWYRVLTWDEMLRDFLRLMEIDTSGNKILVFILYIVIGFGLFGTILTMMLERTREFAMLIAIGMKRRQLAAICMLESVFLSLTGVIAGIAIAFPIMFYFKKNPIPLGEEMGEMMAEYGFEAVMPASTEPSIFLTQATAILIIALLIGLYPAYKALKLNVIQTAK
jgi:putative ABC transport system permease protein